MRYWFFYILGKLCNFPILNTLYGEFIFKIFYFNKFINIFMIFRFYSIDNYQLIVHNKVRRLNVKQNMFKKKEIEKFLEELKNNVILQDIQSINYHMRIRR